MFLFKILDKNYNNISIGQHLNNKLYTCNLKTLVWKKHELTGTPPLPLYGSVSRYFANAQIVLHSLYFLF